MTNVKVKHMLFWLLIGICIFMALLLSIVAFEYTLRYFSVDNYGRVTSAAASNNLSFDKRNSDAVVISLRKQGLDAYPFVKLIYGYDGLMPLGNIPNSHMVYCNEIGPWFIVSTDRYGFNNEESEYDAANKVVFLGDSYTQGACDPITGGYSNILKRWINSEESKYPRWSILNFGIGGNGPLENLATLREYAVPLKPKIIFWFHCDGNDLDDLVGMWGHPMLSKYVDSGFLQNLRSYQVLIDGQMRRFANENVLPRLSASDVKETWEVVYESNFNLHYTNSFFQNTILNKESPSSLEFAYGNFREVMTLAKHDADSIGAKIIPIFIPDGRMSRAQVKVRADRFAATVRSVGLDSLDLTDVLLNECGFSSCYTFGAQGGHFNPNGNKAVSNMLRSYLVEVISKGS